MAHVRLRDKRFLILSVQYGVLSMGCSSSYLGRSSGRPFVSGPSPPHTTVSAATMACFLGIASDRGRARTCNPQLRRLMLYPVELRGQKEPCTLEAGRA